MSRKRARYRGPRDRATLIGLTAGPPGLLTVANAHFVHVERRSDPGCAERRIAPDGEGPLLRVAQSDC